ncbi:hypothetical protein [Bacillus marinisedimentorum]|uniref:hypothetical protein n=1 Tax=Bacillus marinisedimentorum TaxID=1821260 RepID=UPI000873333E|nr:hypothetical protein [Bacillus marinisedimentorum]
MKSKMSFFNRGVMKQDFKQHGWISLLFFVGLFFIFPLQFLMAASNDDHIYHYLKNIFDAGFEISAVATIGVSIGAGIFLFRYLMMKDAADMVHSLPIRRGGLYINHAASGVLLLMIPIWLNAAITALILLGTNVSPMLQPSSLLEWGAILTLISVFSFLFTVFVGMLTGMSVAQGILTIIFLFLPAGLALLVSYQLKIFLYGFSERYIETSRVENWSPAIRFISIRPENLLTSAELAYYIALIVIFFLAGFVLYRNRSLETVTQPLSFRFLRPIFLSGVTFCAMLLGGTYFTEYQQYNTFWLVFGYLFGAAAGYLVAYMVLQKSWRVFQLRTAGGFAGYAAIIALLLFSVQADVFGYESNVPAADEIAGVYFGEDAYQLHQKIAENRTPFSDDQQYIQAVRTLHDQIAARQPEVSGHPSTLRPVFIAYDLNNGEKIVREYTISLDMFQYELKPILEARPYKRDRFALHQLDMPVDKITFLPVERYDEGITIVDQEEISALKALLKREILSLSVDEMNDKRKRWGDIEFLFSNDDRHHYAFAKAHDEIEQWLADKGYLEKARLNADEVASMEIFQLKEKIDINYPEPLESKFEDYSTDKNTMKVEEKQLIEEALLLYSDPYEAPKSEYGVKFTMHDGMRFIGVFADENLPSFINEHF